MAEKKDKHEQKLDQKDLQKGSFFDEKAGALLGQHAFNRVKSATSQVTGAAEKVANVVGSQVGVISQKVGGEELAGEVKDMVSPIVAMVSDILLVAFFAKKQERVSRGQFIVGSLSVLILVGLAVSVVSAIVGPLGVLGGLVFIALPIINLASKRFHDVSLPGRWGITVILPLVGWVVPVLYRGDEGDNSYGPDPLAKDHTPLTTYLLTGLSLLIVAMLVTTLLGFLGLRVRSPQVDMTNPNMIGEEVTNALPGQFQQPINDLDDTTNTISNSVQGTAKNVGTTVRDASDDMNRTVGSATKAADKAVKNSEKKFNESSKNVSEGFENTTTKR